MFYLVYGADTGAVITKALESGKEDTCQSRLESSVPFSDEVEAIKCLVQTHFPVECWGSVSTVKKWREEGGLLGKYNARMKLTRVETPW
jgi:hypothetical protein